MQATPITEGRFLHRLTTTDDLLVARLERQARSERRDLLKRRLWFSDDPAAVLKDWARDIAMASQGPEFSGHPFVTAATELDDTDHLGHQIVAEHRIWLTDQIADMLDRLGVEDATLKADQLMLLRDGAMVARSLGRRPEGIADALIAAGRAVIGR